MPIAVNVKNFVRAETDRMFASFAGGAGGVNEWFHVRQPTPLDQQPVIRMNRDTLYSVAIVDVSAGATFTLPDAGPRYLSAMVANRDHYVTRVVHDPGEYRLTIDDVGTEFGAVLVRTLVDPGIAEDVAAVNALQDELSLQAGSAEPFAPPQFDGASLDAARDALLALARGVSGFEGAFGARSDVDPVMHLIGTAAGWGGLPDSEAIYLNVDLGLPVGRYRLRVRDVPVDGFWSISLYDASGYFPDLGQPVSVNSVTATPDADGAFTVHFGDWDEDAPNRLALVDGWNYVVRLYRPRPEIRDGSWVFPTAEPA